MEEFVTSFSGISAIVMGLVFAAAGFKLWQQAREEREKKQGQS